LMEITHICNMNYVERMWHNGITCPHKWIGMWWIIMIRVDIQIPRFMWPIGWIEGWWMILQKRDIMNSNGLIRSNEWTSTHR
jgi:hypothetical protein